MKILRGEFEFPTSIFAGEKCGTIGCLPFLGNSLLPFKIVFILQKNKKINLKNFKRSTAINNLNRVLV